jgi:hypothetical protein
VDICDGSHIPISRSVRTDMQEDGLWRSASMCGCFDAGRLPIDGVQKLMC